MKVLPNIVILFLLTGVCRTSSQAQCGTWTDSPSQTKAENTHSTYRQYAEGRQAADQAVPAVIFEGIT